MEMKGFYFSLDALMAMTVLSATVMFVGTINFDADEGRPLHLDELHASVVQNASDWNSSLAYEGSVLAYIYEKKFEESGQRPEDICESYFNTSRSFAIFIEDSTGREKLCGDYKVSEDDNLASEQVPVPDTDLNSKFKGPYIATMVIKN